MRTATISGLTVLAVVAALACTSSASIADNTTVKMENQEDSLSYALGVVMGNNVKGQIEVDENTFAKAFGAASRGEETLMDVRQADMLVKNHMQKKQAEKMAEARSAGIKFLEENGKRSEVTTTASGLQYEVLTQGSGPKPSGPATQVKVHYHGTTIDGEVFDSSVERGQPATFGLNQVIKGWTEGVQLMNTGSKYKFFIPSELAYGDRGAGGKIAPGAALIFEVELLELIGE